MVERVLFGPGGASEVTLAAILVEMAQKLEEGQAVALDAPTLAALETVTALVQFPANFPLPAAQVAALTPQTDALTDSQLRAAAVGVTNQSGRALALPPVKATITAVGNTTVYTPTAGKRVRLLWTYAINDPTAATAPLVKVFLGAEEQYRVWAVSKSQVLEGPVDGPIIVNLDATARVAFTAFIEEF